MSFAALDSNQTSALRTALSAPLGDRARFDDTTRLLYSTDASLYQMLPAGVVTPRDEADVVTAVRAAVEHGVPLLPRGAGTGLAGQTVGTGLVLDFTRHMHQILELNRDEGWVRVQPGVVLDELNAWLQPHGLMFAPDVATSNRATIGGMMGNNSCGAHSILYGKTSDHVLEQRVVLADGSTAVFSELSPEEWEGRKQLPGLEGQIYREVSRICEVYAEEIDARFPRIMRRVGGYNLDELVRRRRLNLAALLVGSEGTLATVTEARLRLVPRPRHTGLLVSHFSDLLEALDASGPICAHGPAAVELIDRVILDGARRNRALSQARAFLVGDPEGVLVTELYGESPEEVAARLQALEEELTRQGRGYAHVRIPDQAGQACVWQVRKAGLGVLMGVKGDAKPVGFIEDTAVAPERLAAYIGEMRDLLGGYGLSACYYAHASVGCIHVRPILNLKQPADRVRMREIASRVADLVLKYGGALSAEHGDGLVRSEFQERMFGPVVYGAFRELKRAFDPAGIMNPGKIVDAPPMDRHLRAERAEQVIPVETLLDFSADGGLLRSAELCSGVGACRKRLDGTMCPSYRATREERHSTRGRANMLRQVLNGAAEAESLADPRLHEVLDLCLECKACKTECPSNVDVAKFKYEFLHHYHEQRGRPLRSLLFGHAAAMGQLGARMVPFSNLLAGSRLGKWMLERIGIDSRRTLPAFTGCTFRSWWRSHAPDSRADTRGEVILIADTFTNYHEPEVGADAVRLLEAFGYRVEVPELACCGRPMISKGMLREARRNAERNVTLLEGPARRGIPILGLEPSCLVTYRDEYRELRLGEAADAVAAASWTVEDFLAERHAEEAELPFRREEREVLFHGHCHQKAILGTTRAVRALRMVPGYRVTELNIGCCGMAGSFGYEKEHYDVSMQVGELALLPAARAAAAGTLLVAPGTSCRHQIQDGAGRTALHPVQALARALREGLGSRGSGVGCRTEAAEIAKR
ncbi:MAG: FAD-binding and (Fe-S)-binding domain-containing protein [Armatimonadota bacterium]